MDHVKLKSVIAADSDNLDAQKRSAQGVVDWGLQGSGEFHATHIIVPDILSELGAAAGYAFIQKLKGLGDAMLDYMLPWMEAAGGGRGLDIADPALRGHLESKIGIANITESEVSAVLGLAREKTRFEAGGVPVPNIGDIEAARSL